VTHESSVIWQDGFVDLESLGGRYTPRHITMEPGDVLLFGQHMLHRSHPNSSNRVRCSIDARWFTPATDSTKQYYDVTTRTLIKAY
jgi:ectoine hydroxylase-related dioxygenase (phytanoyl-CoA dioxygenase family)